MMYAVKNLHSELLYSWLNKAEAVCIYLASMGGIEAFWRSIAPDENLSILTYVVLSYFRDWSWHCFSRKILDL